MTLAESVALLTALIAPEPDTSRFAPLLEGGYAGEAAVEVAPCRRPLAPSEIERETVICGTVTVPEDHDAPEGGNTVALAFAVLRAHSSYPAADPVAYLHGGPGMGNLREGLAGAARLFGKFRATRDVVIFDQRAAGISSGSVACHAAMTENVVDVVTGQVSLSVGDAEGKAPSEILSDCLAEIRRSGTDLSKYNTTQNARDVPTVMRALGYETWNLYGISYGTKLTLEVLRSAPEGTRAVVIDGVAPPVVKLYDTLALPFSETLERLVADCAAEEACTVAYPDLGDVIRDVIARAGAGELIVDGDAVPPEVPLGFVFGRNQPAVRASLTPYLPALFYELHRGGDMPTVEQVVRTWNMMPPLPDAASLIARAEEMLSESQAHTLSLAVKDAEIAHTAMEAFGIAVSELRAQLRRDRELGPLPSLLDAEMSAALPETITTPEAAASALRGAAALEYGAPTRGRLSDFVRANFAGPSLGRLLSLIDAMTDAEVAEVYAYFGRTLEMRTSEFQENVDLSIYACQEDVPYNSLEGYREVTAGLSFDLSAIIDEAAAGIFAGCKAFDPVPREGFHAFVESDVPTLSIGSGWDVQTAASWAELATAGLSNAQAVLIAEAGHGALFYQPCVGDMTAAFFDNPGRNLDDSCARASAVTPFYIAPWAGGGGVTGPYMRKGRPGGTAL